MIWGLIFSSTVLRYWILSRLPAIHTTNNASRPYGAGHADDHRLFLGEPFRSPEIYSDDKDREISRYMMKILSDFVKGKDLFWDSIKINGNQSDKISLPRWRIQNNEPFDKVDYDEDRDLCLDWAKYYGLQI
uniref:Uncharacterized protein n=1 Tax=Tetranychus urticae TaxID=32264 RepID=T1KJD1_TETUR